ncbi:hypothetical protein BC834DRAFT_635938 [Gloeopeniophorella convolvens]|nr:hypothetical protein BC834DRAFT_635938 [Gloeopeniophorella convolvens]
MPVRITVDDALTIRKHIKNIGRAYQKRSVAMIQLCRLFLEISPGKTDQIDALRSIFEVVENALKLAVEAGKSRSQVADEAFATAEERLDRYAMDVHPTQESVVGDVHAVIEEAAQKDKDVMKTYSRITARVGFKKTDDPSSGSLIKVNFQILKSPTERGDAPIKTYEFGSGAGIPELLWTLNRLPEDQRVSLKQNPHFYSGSELSDKPSAYTDKFKLEPLRDLRLQEGSNILILLDRAGQIFLEHGRYSRTFGNLWRPGTAVILKGNFGGSKVHQSSCEGRCLHLAQRRHATPARTREVD